MQSNNDNYLDESDFLLKKANEILSKCTISTAPCPLMGGGYCPILESLSKFPSPQKAVI